MIDSCSCWTVGSADWVALGVAAGVGVVADGFGVAAAGVGVAG